MNNMAIWKIFTVVCASWVIVESKWNHHNKRDASTTICDPLNSNLKIQCYCTINSLRQNEMKSAECFLTVDNVNADDSTWNEFNFLQNITKLTLTNTKGILLKYVPTKAIEQTKGLTNLIIKYANIERIPAFAFANLTNLEIITVRDNNIKILEPNAFAHLTQVFSIGLDTNDIEEINRNVFVNLPLLEKLFLPGNKITTIHDRAFIHLNNLKDLEIDKNKLFSLNSETFSGLRKLTRLDLSGNSLEVIGANTFVHLVELRSLNLDGNNIQMLDEKAFHGLGNLQSLTLAHNKLTEIENVNTFKGLENLKTLNLKQNLIHLLKSDVMAPIMANFYLSTSFLDFEDNKFPCDCNLDWFITIQNKTKNNLLKNNLANTKCYPSEALRETWKRISNSDKAEPAASVPEEEDPSVQNEEYEYYDDTQLNGTLFYTDIRFVLNCTNTELTSSSTLMNGNLESTKNSIVSSTKATPSPAIPHNNVIVTTVSTTTITSTKSPIRAKNQGLLDLFVESTTQSTEAPKTTTDSVRKIEVTSEKKIAPTTNRLATVSAKPIDKSYDDHDMASDEAKPDKLKSERSFQEETKNTEAKINNAQRNIGCVSMLTSIIIMLSLRSFL